MHLSHLSSNSAFGSSQNGSEQIRSKFFHSFRAGLEIILENRIEYVCFAVGIDLIEVATIDKLSTRMVISFFNISLSVAFYEKTTAFEEEEKETEDMTNIMK